MHHAQVTVIEDSISQLGHRITSLQLRYWRPIHSELMTHRKFSRSAGSSRARPSPAIIEQVRNDPWGPLHWGINQAGMQAEQELDTAERAHAINAWREAAYEASLSAETLMQHKMHKQIVNRVLEPFTYIDVLVTATEFANWFMLRDHADAQPEIRDLAQQMKRAMDASKPVTLLPGEWHLPYVLMEDDDAALQWLEQNNREPSEENKLELLKRISTARCARISYKAFDGTTSPISKDLELFDKLLGSQPLHASPAEHQATPDDTYGNGHWMNKHEHGNFIGWRQHRKQLNGEFVPG